MSDRQATSLLIGLIGLIAGAAHLVGAAATTTTTTTTTIALFSSSTSEQAA